MSKRVFEKIYKRAEMGVGTLIIFIAMLLVAAVAAGVLIQTAGSLQEKALSTGQQARSQISTNAETIEVSATDGRGGNLTDFTQYLKLSPGSDPIKLDQVIFTFNTKDSTATLKYRGENSICDKNNINGYNTWNAEEIDSDVDNSSSTDYMLEEDLDDDGANDYVFVATSTSVNFSLSTAGMINITIPNISGASETPVAVNVANQALIKNGTTYGYVTISGTTNTNMTILANMTFTVTPYRRGEGYFAVEYEQQGTNWVNGNLQRGDIIKMCYEAPAQIGEDEEIRLNFIPKIGTSTLTQFVTPDVISTERVYLYP
ncbi:MAG: archaellin/type IV pilin N-terminal domain-containing protein [Candidatus Woesearchaeota archaeon]